MSLLTLWIILICGGVLTFAIRLSFIRLFGKQDMPPLLQASYALYRSQYFPQSLCPNFSCMATDLIFRCITHAG